MASDSSSCWVRAASASARSACATGLSARVRSMARSVLTAHSRFAARWLAGVPEKPPPRRSAPVAAHDRERQDAQRARLERRRADGPGRTRGNAARPGRRRRQALLLEPLIGCRDAVAGRDGHGLGVHGRYLAVVDEPTRENVAATPLAAAASRAPPRTAASILMFRLRGIRLSGAPVAWTSPSVTRFPEDSPKIFPDGPSHPAGAVTVPSKVEDNVMKTRIALAAGFVFLLATAAGCARPQGPAAQSARPMIDYESRCPLPSRSRSSPRRASSRASR